ncbi:hypothetical protein [Nocardia gipuzkoensis]
MAVRVFTEDFGTHEYPEGESVKTEAEFNNLEIVDSAGQVIAVYARWNGAYVDQTCDG